MYRPHDQCWLQNDVNWIIFYFEFPNWLALELGVKQTDEVLEKLLFLNGGLGRVIPSEAIIYID